MYDPEGTDNPNEFVEIVNTGDAAVDLTGWKLADFYSTDDLLGEQLILAPNQYAIILESDYDLATGIYQNLLTAGALILFVDDNAIGNGLANSGDSLTLINSLGEVLDAVGWQNPITPGYSLEKVVLDSCDWPNNWRPSHHPLGTPGRLNSVTGEEVDLAITELTGYPSSAAASFDLTMTVANLGVRAADGMLYAGEQMIAQVRSIAPAESLQVSFTWTTPPYYLGRYRLPLYLHNEADFDTSNNRREIALSIPAPPLAIIINEIMYAPLAGEPEWIELVNISPAEINLDQWTFGDTAGSLTFPERHLPAGGYLVVTGDEAWAERQQQGTFSVHPDFPRLNNTGDILTLVDATGVAVDRVDYGKLPIPPPGRSLERVSHSAPSQDPSSWVASPAATGHTGGIENAATAPGEAVALTISPNPLPVNGPESILTMTYATPFVSVNLQITLYDLAGRRLTTLFNEGPVAGAGAIEWDARILDSVLFKTGQYVLVLQAGDASSGQRWKKTARLILIN